MLGFKEFLEEEKLLQKLKRAIYEPEGGVKPEEHLHWFDMDDTLVKHDPEKGAKIRVKDSAGNHVKTLSTSDYNRYKLEPGHSYDYSEFASSKKFADSASPIHKMVRHAQRLVDAGHHVHIITARADMEHPHILLGALKQMGLDMDKIHLHRAGNEGKNPTHVNKAITLNRVIRKLKTQGHNIRKVTGYDDHPANVTSIHDVGANPAGQTLKQIHPNIDFGGIQVSHKGQQVSVKKVAE
jgi:hypothetical protein